MPLGRRRTRLLLIPAVAACVLVAYILSSPRSLRRRGASEPPVTRDAQAQLVLPTRTPTATSSASSVARRPATLAPNAIATPRAPATPMPSVPAVLWPDLAARDPRQEASALGHAAPITSGIEEAPSPDTIGDVDRFWISALDGGVTYEITATLRYSSPHLDLWVEVGVPVDDSGLALSASVFETRIYRRVVDLLGANELEKVRGGLRVSVLNAEFTGATGYFSSIDQFPTTVNPFSNARDLIYMNLLQRTPGTEQYARTLAHEFQHLLHWHMDPNEEAWVTEGASELAEEFCGFGPQEVNAFARNPDIQLTTWGSQGGLAHYDASYLWSAYIWGRFGADFFRQVMQHPAAGQAGIEAALASNRAGLSFEEVYSDWALANYLNDAGLADGRFGYRDASVGDLGVETLTALSGTSTSTVAQFGTDYVELDFGDDLVAEVAFTGTITAPLVPTTPHSGRNHWWSNRGDGSSMTLTRSFDLTDVDQATLRYWIWHDIEEYWDHAYVQASADGGNTWRILAGEHTTVDNHNGESYGAAYTGRSDGWVEDVIDLSGYAGTEVLIRFQMLTDGAVNMPGLCLDDVRILEIGYVHDAESDEDGWQASGFVRTDNTSPQAYSIQFVSLGDGTEIQRPKLDGSNQGSWSIRRPTGLAGRAIVAISGLAPHTTEPAEYTLTVR